MEEEQRMDTDGDCKPADALGDANFYESMAAVSVVTSEHATETEAMMPSFFGLIRDFFPGLICAFFDGFISSRIGQMMQQGANAARKVLALQERITTEGSHVISPRIERLMQVRSEYASAVEFEIEASRDHWSQLHPTSGNEEAHRTDVEILKNLRKKWGNFFHDSDDDELVIGEKFVEGAQAEIFRAEWTPPDGTSEQDSVLKVFKEGWALPDLKKTMA